MKHHETYARHRAPCSYGLLDDPWFPFCPSPSIKERTLLELGGPISSSSSPVDLRPQTVGSVSSPKGFILAAQLSELLNATERSTRSTERGPLQHVALFKDVQRLPRSCHGLNLANNATKVMRTSLANAVLLQAREGGMAIILASIQRELVVLSECRVGATILQKIHPKHLYLRAPLTQSV